MDRDDLGDVDGLLFVFARPGPHAFWMQDVRMALDIAWIDERGRVAWIVGGCGAVCDAAVRDLRAAGAGALRARSARGRARVARHRTGRRVLDRLALTDQSDSSSPRGRRFFPNSSAMTMLIR